MADWSCAYCDVGSQTWLAQGEMHLAKPVSDLGNILGNLQFIPRVQETLQGTRRRRMLSTDFEQGQAQQQDDDHALDYNEEGWYVVPPEYEYTFAPVPPFPELVETGMGSRFLQPGLTGGSRREASSTTKRRSMGVSPSTGQLFLSTDGAPSVPQGMILSRPYSLRTMFFSLTMDRIYVIGGTEPLRNSSYDGKPVLRSIYQLNTVYNPPAWTLVFDGGPDAGSIVEIQACVGTYDMSDAAGLGRSDVVACAFTNAQDNRLKVFQLDAINSYSYSVMWDGNLAVGRRRFRTALVPMPRFFSGQLSSFPDLVVGVPVDAARCVMVRLHMTDVNITTRPFAQHDVFPLGAGNSYGTGSFVSMAFLDRSPRADLFAVDEQPALWRWQLHADHAPLFYSRDDRAVVQRYVHPMQNSIWSIMVLTNRRVALATDASVNLWTQCSPCPEGTVTSANASSLPMEKRCMCPSGTYTRVVDFKAKCFACTSPTSSSARCTGGYYRTLANPVCPGVGNTYDNGCKKCTTQADCPPKRLLAGTPCTGEGTNDTTQCTVCPNPCVAGVSFVSNDCAVDKYSVCTSCKDTCGANKFVSRECSIEDDTQCRQCNLVCPSGKYMQRTCQGDERQDASR
jgi:hypothetical protein